ncbi:phage antirepressor Ant, partial [Gemella sp. 19428wG2_WT2a]
MNLIKQEKNKITTLELLEQINFFRKDIEGKAELLHKDLLKIVRNEFEEEIDEGKISPISYKDSLNRERPMFDLTLSQAKQVLVRESKAVRKAVIKYIEELEEKLKVPSTYKEALISLVNQIEENEKLQLTVAV